MVWGRKEKDEDPVSTLARCIVLLDDIRAYRRKDVEKMEETFSKLKKSRFKEHYDLWVKVRPAAERIVDMPLKVAGVPRIIRTLAWLKVANRFGIIVVIFLIAIQIVPAWRRALGPHPFGGHLFLYSLIVVLIVVVLVNLSTVLDYIIRRRIIAYEAITMDEYAADRSRMKDGVSKMMKSLAREANRAGNDPQNFGMVLYFDDYDHIQVVKQWKPKSMGLFKRPYNHYQVIPRA